MSSFWSRILISAAGIPLVLWLMYLGGWPLFGLAIVAAGLPIVLGSAYLGGWFLFALIAVGGLIALHELYRLARPLRPLVLAGYGGALAAFCGAEVSGA